MTPKRSTPVIETTTLTEAQLEAIQQEVSAFHEGLSPELRKYLLDTEGDLKHGTAIVSLALWKSAFGIKQGNFDDEEYETLSKVLHVGIPTLKERAEMARAYARPEDRNPAVSFQTHKEFLRIKDKAERQALLHSTDDEGRNWTAETARNRVTKWREANLGARGRKPNTVAGMSPGGLKIRGEEFEDGHYEVTVFANTTVKPKIVVQGGYFKILFTPVADAGYAEAS